MTETPALLAPFDTDLVETVADRHDLPPADLRELIASHQQQIRDNPGVEDIVYEWRSQFHEQPLLHQTDDVYYLSLREHIWAEFADALELTDTEFDALLAIHDEQIQRATGTDHADHGMVLTRP